MTLAFRDDWIEVHGGDCREVLAALSEASVQTVITSPPYWGLRDYGMAGQLGLEDTPEEYVDHLVEVFREVRRVLRSDGTLWLNLGDSYAAKKRGSDLGWAASRLTNPGTVQKAQAASLRGTGERHRGKGAGVQGTDARHQRARPDRDRIRGAGPDRAAREPALQRQHRAEVRRRARPAGQPHRSIRAVVR